MQLVGFVLKMPVKLENCGQDAVLPLDFQERFSDIVFKVGEPLFQDAFPPSFPLIDIFLIY